MSIKEKFIKAKDATVDFVKTHKKAIAVTVGTVAGCVGIAYLCKNLETDEAADDENLLDEPNEVEVESRWKEEWNDDYSFVENAAEQIERINGATWIIAGPDSFYNENPDTIYIYRVDQDGYYMMKPDEEES